MGTKLLARIVSGGVLALSTAALLTGTAGATTPSCTDIWTNAAGGPWDTASNWSTGKVPTSTDTVCITTAGSYTVVVGNETITVANLTVGGPGSTPTLQIGNGGSNYPAITVTGTVTSAATISDGWGGSFTAGTLVNSGTFEVPSTPYASSFSFASVSNTGTFAAAGTNSLSLTGSGTFDNAGGTISVTGGTLAVSSPTAGSGTLELDSGGQVDIDSTSHLTVADTTAVHGGTICGTPLTVGAGDGQAGGTLAFASTPGTGPACGSGVSDEVFIANVPATLSGTIPAAYTVVAGDGGGAFNTTTLSGDVVNQGTFEPGYGATVTGSGTSSEITNQGTLLVPASSDVSNLNTTLVNTGTVTVKAAAAVTLAAGQAWGNGTNGTNGTLTLATGTVLAIASPSGQTATFTQDGAIASQGTLSVADPLKITGGSICGNALDVGSADGGTGGSLTFAATPAKGAKCASGVSSGHLFIRNVTATLGSIIPAGYTVGIGDGGPSYAHVSTSGGLSNAGKLAPGYGATLTVTGKLTNTGTLSVPASGYTTQLITGDISNSGTTKVSGALTVTPSTGDAVTNSGSVIAKARLEVDAPLINDKQLTIGAGEKVVVADQGSTPSSYTQGVKGTLADPLGSSYGTLQVSGDANLAGTAALLGSSKPPASTSYPFITDTGTSGTFATVTGPFTLTYGATGVTATSAS
jgi:hypothetical protein